MNIKTALFTIRLGKLTEVMSLTLSVMSAMLGVPGAFTGVMLIESMMGLQSRHIHG